MRSNKSYGVFQKRRRKNTLMSTHQSPDEAARELSAVINDNIDYHQHQNPSIDEQVLSAQAKQRFYVQRVK